MPPYHRLVAVSGWTLAVLGWSGFVGMLTWRAVFCLP